jgi:hypothetical protein
MAVRVRRGHREDLPALRHLLGAAAAGLGPRVLRRVVDDVTYDLFVATDAVGGLVGVLAIGYTRTLAHGFQTAVVDTLMARDEAPDLVAALLTFGETRARQRGCREFLVRGSAVRSATAAVLVAAGYRSEDGMVRCL